MPVEEEDELREKAASVRSGSHGMVWCSGVEADVAVKPRAVRGNRDAATTIVRRACVVQNLATRVPRVCHQSDASIVVTALANAAYLVVTVTRVDLFDPGRPFRARHIRRPQLHPPTLLRPRRPALR